MARVYNKNSMEGYRRLAFNKMKTSDMMYVSKPPKSDRKRGSAYLIWDIKFRSWAGVKGISGALTPSFDSKLPSKESDALEDMDPTQKAQGTTRKQNAVAMDAMVQSMSDTDNFNCILQIMNKDADWSCGRLGTPIISSRNIIIPKIVPMQGTYCQHCTESS
jgi:hypothetical protein